jgi:2',3'-cyclic-nucleotide 2'-phosphodiesterase (5'-nucleotidase family)
LNNNVDNADFAIFLDSGGFLRGIGAQNELQTEYLLKGLSQLGYTTLNIGTRDLSSGGEYLTQIERKYPLHFLSANIFYKESGKLYADPYTIIKIKKQQNSRKPPFSTLRVGILGACDARPALFATSRQEPMLESREPLPEIKKHLDIVKRKSDLVVLLYYGRYSNLENILQQTEGIDVVLFGLEYYRVNSDELFHGAVVVSTPSQGKYLSAVKLELDNQKNITDHKMTRTALTESIEDDQKYAQLVAEFKTAEKKLLEESRAEQTQN